MDEADVAKQTIGNNGAYWRKSSRSSFSSQCTEVGVANSGVVVRDSKDPLPTLSFTGKTWQAFIESVKRAY
ncbi:MAG: DUF397 domain-containing protein [Actinobacteria bacterium]|nr:DUF397 domain-containing protein [Actinomycetota bacterium]